MRYIPRGDQEDDEQNTFSSSAPSNPSYSLPKAPVLEKNSGIRISHGTTSLASLNATLAQYPFRPIQRLGEPSSSLFSTIGAIVKKFDPKEGSKKNSRGGPIPDEDNEAPSSRSQMAASYGVMKVWNMQGQSSDEKNQISLMLTGTAFASHWMRIGVGSVILALNPQAKTGGSPAPNSNSGPGSNLSASSSSSLWSLHNTNDLKLLGHAVDLGPCKAMKKNGEPCGVLVNLSAAVKYCIFHISLAQQEARGGGSNQKGGVVTKNTSTTTSNNFSPARSTNNMALNIPPRGGSSMTLSSQKTTVLINPASGSFIATKGKGGVAVNPAMPMQNQHQLPLSISAQPLKPDPKFATNFLDKKLLGIKTEEEGGEEKKTKKDAATSNVTSHQMKPDLTQHNATRQTPSVVSLVSSVAPSPSPIPPTRSATLPSHSFLRGKRFLHAEATHELLNLVGSQRSSNDRKRNRVMANVPLATSPKSSVLVMEEEQRNRRGGINSSNMMMGSTMMSFAKSFAASAMQTHLQKNSDKKNTSVSPSVVAVEGNGIANNHQSNVSMAPPPLSSQSTSSSPGGKKTLFTAAAARNNENLQKKGAGEKQTVVVNEKNIKKKKKIIAGEGEILHEDDDDEEKEETQEILNSLPVPSVNTNNSLHSNNNAIMMANNASSLRDALEKNLRSNQQDEKENEKTPAEKVVVKSKINPTPSSLSFRNDNDHEIGEPSTVSKKGSVVVKKVVNIKDIIAMAKQTKSINDNLRMKEDFDAFNQKIDDQIQQEKIFMELDQITEQQGVTGHYCLQCKMWYPFREKSCISSGHVFETKETTKRWYSCDGCGKKIPWLGDGPSPYNVACSRCKRVIGWSRASAAPHVQAFSASDLMVKPLDDKPMPQKYDETTF